MSVVSGGFKFFWNLKPRPLQFSMLKNLPKKPLYHPAKFGQNVCYGVEMFEEQTDTLSSL
jgi:hypothetical protein